MTNIHVKKSKKKEIVTEPIIDQATPFNILIRLNNLRAEKTELTENITKLHERLKYVLPPKALKILEEEIIITSENESGLAHDLYALQLEVQSLNRIVTMVLMNLEF